MIKKIIAAITLFAFVITNMGCSKVVRVNAANINSKPQTKNGMILSSNENVDNIVAVEVSSGIIGIALNYQDIIAFDSLGGKYDPVSKTISGLDTMGTYIKVGLNEIEAVMHSDRSAYISFDKNMGTLKAGEQLIEGTTIDGVHVGVPLDEVLFIRTKRNNIILASVVILLSVTFVVLFIDNLENLEFDHDDIPWINE